MSDADTFLTPRRFSTWLLAAIFVSSIIEYMLGSESFVVAGSIAVFGGAVGFYSVGRWLGRCGGYFIGSFLKGLGDGRGEARMQPGLGKRQ